MVNNRFRNLKLPDDDKLRILEKTCICHECACPVNLENSVVRRPFTDSDIKSDAQLEEKLRAFRSEAAGVKPNYIVFDNKMLGQLVRIRPTFPFELCTVDGFPEGGERLRKYGENILDIILKHEEEEEEGMVADNKLLMACNDCSRGGPPDPLPGEQRAAVEGPPFNWIVDPTGTDTITGRITGHLFKEELGESDND